MRVITRALVIGSLVVASCMGVECTSAYYGDWYCTACWVWNEPLGQWIQISADWVQALITY
jgi:hypothetical protein